MPTLQDVEGWKGRTVVDPDGDKVGTLEEFFETLTWAQLGLHRKPCALLDVAGFWDPLIAMLGASVDEGFVTPAHLDLILTGADVNDLLDRMAAYQPPGKA